LDLDPLEEVDTVHLTKVVEKVEVDNLSMELVVAEMETQEEH
jgi:hypothetical protein